MGLTAEIRCKNHPNHRQSQGVCPSCLSEKLNQILLSSKVSRTTSSSSSPSPGSVASFSSVSLSSAPSPNTRRKQQQPPLGRSLSMVVPVMKTTRAATLASAENRRGGFWSRLLLRLDSGKRRKFASGSRT
ncbi:hypothetical protein QJS04_geneDACA009319 [Acorus gramineus]|uniref:Uncharacterized protein n=1 Tax=Acorus gramineus TaxID=55184 RepID=A0AAV9AIH2_ACOGR|nr:hypothetical protein QJS04_geneDACA009319 [Acorus gramineus]